MGFPSMVVLCVCGFESLGAITLRMSKLIPLFVSLCLLTGFGGLLKAQVIELDPAIRQAEGQLTISIQSSDSRVQGLASRAFGLHGGFVVTSPDKAAIDLEVESAGGSVVQLTIRSGQGQVQKRKVSGSSVQNAVLRACDLVVEWAVKTEGFFAGKLAFVGKQRGVSEVYTSNLLFGSVRPLTADRALVTGPSWAPDGSRLLYTTYHKTGFPDIYEINLSSGRRSPIATYKGTNSGGRFSPDGRKIAMVLSGTGNAEIWVGDRDGQNRRRLTTNKSLEASPTWSPDGSRLVFTSDAAGKPQLYEVSVNGGPMRRLPTNVSRYCAEPAWNPLKSNEIAFTAAVGGGFQIFLYDTQKRSSRQLTTVGDSAVEPCWTNDGRHLIFTQRQGWKTRLMLLDTETGKVSPLHNPNFGDASSASFAY